MRPLMGLFLFLCEARPCALRYFYDGKMIKEDIQCAKKLARRLEVKVLYSVRRSEPPKLRVMGVIG